MDRKKALTLCNSVLEHFRIGKDETAFKEYFPIMAEDRETSYLWSYFAMTGMLYHACKAGLGFQTVYRQMVEGFRYYRSFDAERGTIKYHSERGIVPDGGHGPCFFDDNIWVARNYLFAHEIFGEKAYREEAEKVVAYIRTGWNEELGGLVWNENGLTSQGTVQELERGLSANACGIIVNARLYQLTEKKDYWDWALRFDHFCKTVRDPETGIYYNGIHTALQGGARLAGEVNRDLWSYNSGSMILADLFLFEISKDKAYLADAEMAAVAAHNAFLRTDKGVDFYHDFIWFLAILVEGFEALRKYNEKLVRPFFRILRQSFDFTYENHRSDASLLPHDTVMGWRMPGAGNQDWHTNSDYDRMLLTHSGMAEIACLMGE